MPPSATPVASVTPPSVEPDASTAPPKDLADGDLAEMFAELPIEVVDAIGAGIDPQTALANYQASQGIAPEPTATPLEPTPPEPALAPEPEAAVVPPPAETPQDPAPATPEPEPALSPQEKKTGRRIRLGHLPDHEKVNAASQAVKDGIYPTFEAAFAAQNPAVAPVTPPPSAEPAAAEPVAPPAPAPVAAPTSPTAEVDAQIEATKALLKTATEEFDTDAAFDAQVKLSELMGERSLAVMRAEQSSRDQAVVESAKQTFDTRYDENWGSLVAAHPELNDEKGDLYELVESLEVNLLNKTQNGDANAAALTANPNYLTAVVERAIRLRGGAAPVPAPVQAPGARPIGSLSPATTPAPPIDSREATRILLSDDITAAMIDAALDAAAGR